MYWVFFFEFHDNYFCLIRIFFWNQDVLFVNSLIDSSSCGLLFFFVVFFVVQLSFCCFISVRITEAPSLSALVITLTFLDYGSYNAFYSVMTRLKHFDQYDSSKFFFDFIAFYFNKYLCTVMIVDWNPVFNCWFFKYIFFRGELIVF